MPQNFEDMKIILLGKSYVGKTYLINRLLEPDDSNETIYTEPTTVGSFSTLKLTYKNVTQNVQLYDTAGQEKYQSLTKSYVHGADYVLLCFSQDTGIDDLMKYVTFVHENEQKSKIIGILTKCDLLVDNQRNDISTIIRNNYIHSNIFINYFITSSVTNEGIKELLKYLSQLCVKVDDFIGTDTTSNVIELSSKEEEGKKSNCC